MNDVPVPLGPCRCMFKWTGLNLTIEMTDHFFWQDHITRMGYGDEDFVIYGIMKRQEGFVGKNHGVRERERESLSHKKDHAEYLQTFIKRMARFFLQRFTHSHFMFACLSHSLSTVSNPAEKCYKGRNAQNGNKSARENKFTTMSVIGYDLGCTVKNCLLCIGTTPVETMFSFFLFCFRPLNHKKTNGIITFHNANLSSGENSQENV